MLAWSYGAGVDKLALASGLNKAQVEAFLRKLFVEFPTVQDMTGITPLEATIPASLR